MRHDASQRQVAASLTPKARPLIRPY
jgi:hypothetical protein